MQPYKEGSNLSWTSLGASMFANNNAIRQFHCFNLHSKAADA